MGDTFYIQMKFRNYNPNLDNDNATLDQYLVIRKTYFVYVWNFQNTKLFQNLNITFQNIALLFEDICSLAELAKKRAKQIKKHVSQEHDTSPLFTISFRD